ncbi:MAG TPA: DUF6134 family protein [Parafilimonas sp.]|nr:DUF6134 family protein [Parafilimonas sp.]
MVMLIKSARTFIVLCLFSFTSYGQVRTLEYDVSYKGKNIGTMQLYQNQTGKNIFTKTVADVKTNLIFTIKVNTEEESMFQSGKLVYSNLIRRVNGKEKANKQTKAVADTYQTFSFGKPGPVNNEAIDYNFSLLYCMEPVNKQEIYSDNFQQFINIKKVSEHQYKIELPDGNCNYYSFQNGICSNAELHHTFYTIHVTLKK